MEVIRSNPAPLSHSLMLSSAQHSLSLPPPHPLRSLFSLSLSLPSGQQSETISPAFKCSFHCTPCVSETDELETDCTVRSVKLSNAETGLAFGKLKVKPGLSPLTSCWDARFVGSEF